ncbi:MAG: HD domain-containing protein [Candidatus Thorarchaeota archaeon]|nr:HD domain-containing protein [Candidatus Thorarchaeota archaeon]
MPELLSIMNNPLITRLKERILRETSLVANQDWQRIVNTDGPPIYNYRRDHVASVVATACYLAKEAGADMDVVLIAAWLHDVAKPGLGGPDDHGVEGAKIATQILTDEGIDSKMIERVTYAIRSHVGLVRDTPLDTVEAQVLWEADKLVKLGVIGFIHYVINGLQLKPGMGLVDLHSKLEEFLPLAEKIAGSMITPPAKRMAKERLQVLKDVVLSLKRELYFGGE